MRTMKMKWFDGTQDSNQCAVCGRQIKAGVQGWGVHVIDGGSLVLHPDDEVLFNDPAGDLGIHDLGSECRKHFGEFTFKTRRN